MNRLMAGISCLAVWAAVADGAGEQGDQPFRPASFARPAPVYAGAGHIAVFTQVPGALGMMASVGEIKVDPDGYRSTFDGSGIVSTPGFFSVPLEGNRVKVEVTATDHVAAYRYTFPESQESHVLVDAGCFLENFTGGEIHLADDQTMEGSATYGVDGGSGKVVYYSFHFSKPFKRRGIWEGGEVSDSRRSARVDGRKPMGAFAYFWTHEGETILMKVGLSEESMEDARARMLAEFPGWDFNQLRRASEQAWQR